MNDVYNTFLTESDWTYDHIVPISPDASNRKYFRSKLFWFGHFNDAEWKARKALTHSKMSQIT